MGKLLSSFTYPRNAFASTAAESAEKTHDTIGRVRSNTLHEKDEPFNDAKTFLGVVRRDNGVPIVTKLGKAFEDLYNSNQTDAWRWLVTRAMWRFSVPNGTKMQANADAAELGANFNFFDLLTRVIWMLNAEEHPGNSLYFDELLPILDDDAAWELSPSELFAQLHAGRSAPVAPPHLHRALLGDLEDEYNCGRDYMNTVFRKAFHQSGLFDLTRNGNQPVGIRLSDQIPKDPVLWRRLRYVLDHPVRWQDPVDDEESAS